MFQHNYKKLTIKRCNLVDEPENRDFVHYGVFVPGKPGAIACGSMYIACCIVRLLHSKASRFEQFGTLSGYVPWNP